MAIHGFGNVAINCIRVCVCVCVEGGYIFFLQFLNKTIGEKLIIEPHPSR